MIENIIDYVYFDYLVLVIVVIVVIVVVVVVVWYLAGFVNNHMMLGAFLEQSMQLVDPSTCLHYMEYTKYFSMDAFIGRKSPYIVIYFLLCSFDRSCLYNFFLLFFGSS